MSANLRDFLLDLLQAIEPFKDALTHVMLREKDGKVMAAAKSRDGSISLQATPRGELPGFHGKACLGSLPYLRGALSAGYMEGGKVELTYGPSSKGGEEVLRSIQLKGANRYNVFYQAIDPVINQRTRISLPTGLDWPLAFGIDTDFIKGFTEMYRVAGLTPKTNTERDDIFQLAYHDDCIEGIFGDKNHQSSVVLSRTVEGSTADKVSAHFLMSRFRSMLNLVGKDAIGYLSDKAIRVDIETGQAEYRFVNSAKIVKTVKDR